MSILVELPPDQYDRRAFAKFNETSTGFDLDIARAMMWMSQLAYETHVPDTINRVSPFWESVRRQVAEPAGAFDAAADRHARDHREQG